MLKRKRELNEGTSKFYSYVINIIAIHDDARSPVFHVIINEAPIAKSGNPSSLNVTIN